MRLVVTQHLIQSPNVKNTKVRLEADYGPISHPQPVILDSALRFPTTAKLLLPESPTRPWIMTSPSGYNNTEKRTQLQNLGAKIFVIDLDPQGRSKIKKTSRMAADHLRRRMFSPSYSTINLFCFTGHLSIPHLLSTIQSQSIRSLMVEGGASVISSFLESGLVHSVLLTIAPVYVGQSGVSAVQRAEVIILISVD